MPTFGCLIFATVLKMGNKSKLPVATSTGFGSESPCVYSPDLKTECISQDSHRIRVI